MQTTSSGIPPEEAFVAAYSALLDTVRRRSPAAPIFCVLGPTLSDVFPPGEEHLTIARRYVQRVVEQAKATGDAEVRYLEFPPQRRSDGYGCNYHPSVTTHRLMAARLAAAIRERW